VLWCLISVSGVVSVGRGGVSVSRGVVDSMVHGGGMVHSVDRGMVHHGGGMVDSVVHWGGMVHGVVGGGVVNSVSCSTEVGESSEGHVGAGSHKGDESNQGKGLK
jgi:hypothetical protein